MKVHLISSRFRVLAIASTWIVALLCGSASSIDSIKVVHKNGALDCTAETNFQYAGAAGFLASLIFITILYCIIAVTLRRKNKALPTSAVNGNVQRKRQAMKMSICVVAAFYLCFIPLIIIVLSERVLEKTCLLLRVLWPFTGLTINLSSSANPIIFFIFVANYRRGLREFFGSFLIKCSKRRHHKRNKSSEYKDPTKLL